MDDQLTEQDIAEAIAACGECRVSREDLLPILLYVLPTPFTMREALEELLRRNDWVMIEETGEQAGRPSDEVILRKRIEHA